MAHIRVTPESRKHLIDRAQQRFSCSRENASQYINSFIKVLRYQAPDDWRFTHSPVARFLIYDEKSGFRFLGRTYRDTGRDFLNELKQTTLPGESLPSEHHQKLIQKLARQYLDLLQDPAATIVHELKTIYSRDKDLSELKHSYRAARQDLPHLIPVDTKRIATRPNAIVTGDGELWVRQNEWIKIPQDVDYLLFQRLTRKGVDKSSVRLYSHDRNGNMKLVPSNAPRRGQVLPSRPELPAGLHTGSYWSLPTRIDAIYLDLKYKAENFPASLTAKESLLKFRIELIINHLKGELGWKEID